MGRLTYEINSRVVAPLHQAVVNPLRRGLHKRKTVRRLEIGPGSERIAGFETLNIVSGRNVDYVGDATKKLPFETGTFDLIYASHIIEHVAWYQVQATISEWVRALKPGGQLEVWTPNGLAIAEAFVAFERSGSLDFHQDGWWRYNEGRDACLWASGRAFSYGDGTGKNHPNWHRALFSPRHLMNLFAAAGLVEVGELSRNEVRGYDHGWINLGVRGTKPA